MYCLVCGLPLGRKKKCPRCNKRIKKLPSGECEYCIDIYNTTTASPRRKYKYCPMCGKELDRSKIKEWRFEYGQNK